jgi:hypothetical protein
MKIIAQSAYGTTHGRLEGEPGEECSQRCDVCQGRLVAGDLVFVTTHITGQLMALAHRPDCVAALTREAEAGR